jgi:hypothetical protein
MAKRSPMAAAILLKLKGKGDEGADTAEDAGGEDEYDPASEAKQAAIKRLFKAFETRDHDKGAEALEAFIQACYPGEDEAPEDDAEAA